MSGPELTKEPPRRLGATREPTRQHPASTGTATPTIPETQETSVPVSAAASPRTMLRGLAWDVGLPVAAYYVLHLFGLSDWAALLAASGVAAARLLWTAARERTLNPFAAVMLTVYGIGFALSFATGDPRMLLLRHSITTAAVGLVFLVTAIRGRRPLTLAALQSFQPAKADELGEQYTTNPDARRGHRLCSTVWGLGLMAESLVRIPLVFLLPPSIAVAVTEALFAAAIVLLAVWNAWYVRRVTRRGGTPGGDHATEPSPGQ